MTIAIQGDWGTGKTSAIKSLQRNLMSSNPSQREYWQIEFNNWQYSQFDLGDQLVFSLIAAILGELESRLADLAEKDKLPSKLRKQIKDIAEGIFTFSMAAAQWKVDSIVPGTMDFIGSGLANIRNNSDSLRYSQNNSIELISNLCSQLREVVRKITSATVDEDGFKGPKRIVVYIDDLDRLEPQRAIAVMEAIKVFWDIDDCVFVLAIDFDVVLRGVRSKYGDEDFEEEKARAYFDKIIQVPFNLPVRAYQVKTLLRQGMESIGIRCSESELSQFEELTLSSTGRNPRAIKRLVNTFGLLKSIGLNANNQGGVFHRTVIFLLFCVFRRRSQMCLAS